MICILCRWTQKEEAESNKAISAVCSAYPELAKEMLPSENQIRRALKSMNLQLPEGAATKDLPIVRIPPRMVEAVRVFGRKLAVALHYKHSKRIVPSNAGVVTWYFTNAQHIAGKFPKEVLTIMPGIPELTRNAQPLQDQFYYQYGVSDDGTLGAYCAAFRGAFTIAAIVSFDPTLIDEAGAQRANSVV